MRAPSIVLLFWTFLLSRNALLCHAKEEENACNENEDLSIIGLKHNGKLVSQFLQDSDSLNVLEAVSILLKHFEDFREPLVKLNGSSDGIGLDCIDKVENQNKISSFIGLGNVDGCVVKYTDRDSKLKEDPQTIIDAIRSLATWSTSSIGDSIVKLYGKEWPKVYSNDEFRFDEGHARECYGYRSIAYRVNGVWGLRTSFYNESWDTDVPEDGREVISEIVSVGEGRSTDFIPLDISNCFASSHEDDRRTPYTTMMHLTSEETRWDYGDRSDNQEHYAVEGHHGIKQALGETARQKELLQDSGEPSNIAVLILPGLLALFPIGLFQEANIGTIFVYSVVTDVVSVLPILIKAGELIHYGRKSYYGIHTQYHGHIEGSSTAVGQVYPAVCKFKPWISNLGFVLLSVGLGLMFIGIYLEIVTMRAVKKRKDKWNADPEKSPIKELHGLLWYASRENEKS